MNPSREEALVALATEKTAGERAPFSRDPSALREDLL